MNNKTNTLRDLRTISTIETKAIVRAISAVDEDGNEVAFVKVFINAPAGGYEFPVPCFLKDSTAKSLLLTACINAKNAKEGK